MACELQEKEHISPLCNQTTLPDGSVANKKNILVSKTPYEKQFGRREKKKDVEIVASERFASRRRNVGVGSVGQGGR